MRTLCFGQEGHAKSVELKCFSCIDMAMAQYRRSALVKRQPDLSADVFQLHTAA